MDSETLETPSVAEVPLVVGVSAKEEEEEVSEEIDIIGNSIGLSMEGYLREVRKVESLLRELDLMLESLKKLHQNSLVAVTSADIARSESALEALIEDADALSGLIGGRLKALEVPTQSIGTALKNQRNKYLHHARLASNFLNLLTRYRKLERASRNTYIKRLTRQYRVVNPEATNAEIDQVVGTKATPIFAAAMINNAQRSAQAKSALAEVQERHREILNIDASLQNLSNLFQQMRMLVAQNEEKLRTISAHVEAAGIDIEETEKAVSVATRAARSVRKQKWILLILLLIVVCITGLVLGLVIPRTQMVLGDSTQAAVTQNWVVPGNTGTPATSW